MDIINANILTAGERHNHCFIQIKANKIIAVGSMSEYKRGGGKIIDASNCFICPGFIDIHNHGACMYDAMDRTEEAFENIAKFHIEHGVTSFLLTTMTAPLDMIGAICKKLRSFRPSVPVDILGIHMEGPFISSPNRGAQPEEYLLFPTDMAMEFLDENKDCIKLMTISPDVKNIDRVIEFCINNKITVSGGHDDAIDAQVYRAIERGMSGITHMYCCSSTISRRGSAKKHIGLTEIGLAEDCLYNEVIADGYHIPYDLFRLIYKCKGYEKICLVSDSIRATGMEKGKYMLGSDTDGVVVQVVDNVAILPGKNMYAGSITPIAQMVEDLVNKCHIPLEEAVYMASGSQAAFLELHGKGAIEEGYDASLNLLDEKGHLLEVLVGEDFRYLNK